MTATRLDITIEQGADYDTPFPIFSPGGESVDLAGYAAYLQIKLASIYYTPILTLTSAGGGLLIDAEAGTVLPVITPGVSAAINAGRYLYDLKLVSPSGKTTRAYQGAAYVSQEVTDYEPPPPDADTDLLTQMSLGFIWQDGIGVDLPETTLTLFTSQDGSTFVFQDGSGWVLPGGSPAEFLSLEDGTAFIFQDGSQISLPQGMAG